MCSSVDGKIGLHLLLLSTSNLATITHNFPFKFIKTEQSNRILGMKKPRKHVALVCIPSSRQLKKRTPFPARYSCRAVFVLPLHFMIFYWRHNVQFSLYTFGCVVSHIFFDCQKKVFFRSELMSIVHLSFHNSPEAFHRAVINTMRHS